MTGVASKCKVICKRGPKNPRLKHDRNREWVTIIESIFAAGIVLPPMVINQGAGHYKGWCAEVECIDTATFSYSPMGWADIFLGMEWLIQNFEKYTAEP